MVDLRQSPLWAKYLEALGWKAVEIKNLELKIKNFVYIKKLSFLGSVVKVPKISIPLPLANIDKISKENQALFIKLEPNFSTKDNNYQQILKSLINHHYSQDKWALTNTKTIKIDLKLSEEELLKNMEKDTRYSIKASQRKGVKISESANFEAFLDLYQETARRNRFWIGPLKELKIKWEIFSKKEAATILFAYSPNNSERPLAAAMVFFWDNTSYYLHAASSAAGRSLFAPYLVLWEIIKLSRKRGCKILDLEGIADLRIPYTKRWQGFSHFKRGFGGKEVTYIGSFTKYYNPLIKALFKIGEVF